MRRQPRRSSRRSGLPWEAASRRTASSRRTTRGQGPFQAQPPRPARPSQGRLAQPARAEFRRCRPSCRPTRRARPLPRGTASLRQAETGSPNRGGCVVVENDPRPRHCRRVRGGGHSETESGPGLSVGTGRVARVCVTGRTPTGRCGFARRPTLDANSDCEREGYDASASMLYVGCEFGQPRSPRACRVRRRSRDERRRDTPFTPGRHVPAKGAQGCISCTYHSLVCITHTPA